MQEGAATGTVLRPSAQASRTGILGTHRLQGNIHALLGVCHARSAPACASQSKGSATPERQAHLAGCPRLRTETALDQHTRAVAMTHQHR